MDVKRSGKHYLLGLETEFMILDRRGRVMNQADRILQQTGELAKKECAHNMLEIDAHPSDTIRGTALDLLGRAELLAEVMDKHGFVLYPFGTYPGRFVPRIRNQKRYAVQQQIFGDRFAIASRCVGFHCHYTLPPGIFDHVQRQLRLPVRPQIGRSVVDNYNMLIALDPVLTTFSQSSPFYQGTRHGKDARVMFYRGSWMFGVDGLYTDYQEFGGLPAYKHTFDDVLRVVEDRFRDWSLLLKKLETAVKALALYGSVLDTNWSPVKLNPHGTFEMRGMDMNRFEIITSLAVMLRFTLRFIHEHRIRVVERQDAIQQPFQLSDGELAIPPYEYVSVVLQRDAAVYGLESRAVLNYCTAFLRLARQLIPRDRLQFLRSLQRMLRRRQTVADDCIAAARRRGCEEMLPTSIAAELALRWADGMARDIARTRRLVRKVSAV